VISDPLTEKTATDALRRVVADFDRLRTEGRVEIVQTRTWYFTGDTPDLQSGYAQTTSIARKSFSRVS
jgi:hypothetical protein